MSAPTTLLPVHLIPSLAAHPLSALLRAAARRALPPVHGTVAAGPAPSGPCAVAVAIGGLSMVAADVAPEWVSEHVPAGEGGAVAPPFLAALADRLGVPTPGVDVLLVARKPPQAGPRAALRPSDRVDATWAADRTDVTCWADPDGGGVIMIGRGPGGRLDLRVELEGSERQWLTPATVVRGRDLLEAARTLADGDLFASVPAYDATALRTYLCGGFRAVGAEARFRTGPTPTWFS
jgi:hypothetical protein